MTTARDVAHYIIKTFQEAEDPVTNLKLQKLLYYVQGWHLGLNEGQPAFSGEFQAWVHGPVCPDIYHAFKQYRWNPIVEDVPEVPISTELKAHVDEVLEVYGAETGWALEQRTHREAPWLAARKGLPADAESTAVITPQSMGEFFASEANEG